MTSGKFAIVTNVHSNEEVKALLLAEDITVGTIFTFNYSPLISGLVSISVNNRIIALRAHVFEKIDWKWVESY